MNSPPEWKVSARRAREIAQNRLGTRIPRSTMYKLIEDGRIESLRVGSRILVSKSALEAFIKRCRDGERF